MLNGKFEGTQNHPKYVKYSGLMSKLNGYAKLSNIALQDYIFAWLPLPLTIHLFRDAAVIALSDGFHP